MATRIRTRGDTCLVSGFYAGHSVRTGAFPFKNQGLFRREFMRQHRRNPLVDCTRNPEKPKPVTRAGRKLREIGNLG
jgi:hypothetical protein